MKVLFQMVHSLTKTEKRYFKLQFAKQKVKYLVLFGILEKQTVYDRVLIKKTLLKNKDFDFKNLAVDVNYLSENILQSLQLFYQNKNANFRIKNRLSHIEILYNKGHFEESLKLINKVKKLILKYEHYTYAYEIGRWEQKILGNQSSIDEVLMAVSDNKILYNKLSEIEILNEYYLAVNRFRTKWPVTEVEFKELLTILPFNDYLKCKSRSAMIKYLQIHQLYSFLTLNKLEENKILTIIILLIDNEFKVYREEYPMNYLTIYSRKLYLDLTLFPDNILNTSKFFLSLPYEISKHNERTVVFTQVYMINFVLSYYIQNEAFLNATTFIKKIDFNIENYINKVNLSFLLGTYYKMSYVFFRNGDLDKSLDFVNLIIQSNQFSDDDDIYLFSQIFNLIIHFEKGNYVFIENKLLFVRKLMKKTKKFIGAFEIFFNILKDFIAYKSRIDNDLIDKILIDLQSRAKNNDLSLINKYFDINTWVVNKKKVVVVENIFNDKLVRFDLLFKQ